MTEKNREKSLRVALEDEDHVRCRTEWAGVADIRLEKGVLVFTRREIRSQVE